MICQKAVSRPGFRLVPETQFFSKSWATNFANNIQTESFFWIKPELSCVHVLFLTTCSYIYLC